MPCNSDHLESSHREKELSKVAALLDELDSGTPVDPSKYGNGYHDAVYNKTSEAEKLVPEICERLRSVDVSKYSLEMQIWWRDHQEADRKRIEFELNRKKKESEKQAAIAKLTDYERKLLGI